MAGICQKWQTDQRTSQVAVLMAANRLNGVDTLGEFDPKLYRMLAERYADQK